jgi:hypothetical protein
MRKGINLAERNGMWKGDKVGYTQLHVWIRRRLLQPHYCERCGKKKKKLDLANLSGKYLRRLDDWEYICRSCHMSGDGRKDNLLKGCNFRIPKPCNVCGKLTIGIKFCKECAKVRRIEWWRIYNKTPKRLKYLREYHH